MTTAAHTGADLRVWLRTADDMAALAADPALALIVADLDEWMAAQSCECEALCTCEAEEAA